MVPRLGQRPALSLIVPTRGRPTQLRRFLNSLAATAADLDSFEVLLVIDEDDPASRQVGHELLAVKPIIVPPGLTMGALNRAGYDLSSGQYLMLLNDDVVARTPGWDETVLACCRRFADDIVLVHVNDTIFKDSLCTFPLVSRTYCEMAGGICPREYVRYRIDDHIEDVFNLLAVLDERRTVYLPDVVFEHFNFGVGQDGGRIYTSDPAILALDAPRFEALAGQRKQLALALKGHIDRLAQPALNAAWRGRLDRIDDPDSIRGPGRLVVESESYRRSSANTTITIALVTADSRRPPYRACLSAIKRHTRNYELVLLDHGNMSSFHSPRELNRLLLAARTDHVVLVRDEVLVEPGWLDALLAYSGGNVGVVIPLHRGAGDRHPRAGLAFHPDGSGHHGHVLRSPESPEAVLSFTSPVALIDRTKCRRLLFDEGYHQYFFDVDFGLRVWEAGLRVVCTPEATVTYLGGGPLPYGPGLNQELFERDRRLFVAAWMNTDRFKQLDRAVFRSLPELRGLLDLAATAERLLLRTPDETLLAFRQRAIRVLAAVAGCPIYYHAVLEGARQRLHDREPEVNDPETGHLAVLLKLAGRVGFRESWRRLRCWVSEQANRARFCIDQRGYRGLAGAVGRRLLRLLSGAKATQPLPARPGLCNPTREARDIPL